MKKQKLNFCVSIPGLTEVIDRLKTTDAYKKGNAVNMITTTVYDSHTNRKGVEIVNHEIGSFHCFAGWLGTTYTEEIEAIKKRQKELKCRGCHIAFTFGRDKIVKLLGFNDQYHLRSWLHKNPSLWENEYGGNLFSSPHAFGCNYKNITMKKIVEHLEGFKARLENHKTMKA
jgi:hypothetical protein